MLIKKWEKLPPELQIEEVRPYYEILRKKNFSLFWKRVFDIFVSGVMLIILLPFLLILALAIVIDSRGGVFYRQERVTQYGKHFRIFKFRSMVSGADKNGTLAKIDKLNNFIIEKFGYNRDYFKTIIKDFISNIGRLLQNILDSRSIPKEDLEKIKDEFKNEIIDKYKRLYKLYSNNFNNLIKRVKDKLESLKKNSYKKYLGIHKSKISEDIQKFSEEIVNNYNKLNREYYSLIIQSNLYESLKKILLNYEERRNFIKKGKKWNLVNLKNL